MTKNDLLSRHPKSVSFLQRGGTTLIEHSEGMPYDCLLLSWRKRVNEYKLSGEVKKDVEWTVTPASYWYSRN